jgi:nucleoside-diphosphate-sugar epimerase
MHALVTGGGGFLGMYVVEQLIARGDDVRVFCRQYYPRLDQLGAEWFPGDVRDAAAVANACEGIDAVFHAAAVPGIWGPWKLFHGVNTLGTLNIIEGCRRHNVAKLIYTSSPSVIYDGKPHENVDESYPYPDPKTFLCHYPHTKMLAEKAVLAANGDGLATTALRPHLIWGPRDNHLIPRLIRRAKSGRLRRVGDGTNLVSTTYVENAAVAHLQAEVALGPHSANAGKAYFINESEPVNLWNWIDDLLHRAGLPPVKKRISAASAWRVGAVLETAFRCLFLRREPPMTRFLASQLSRSHYYSIDAAKRDFGFTPVMSTDEGMRRLEPELKRLASA